MRTDGRRLRVAFAIDELAPTGGTETQLRLLLRSFDRTSIEPHLVLLRGPEPTSNEIGDAEILRLDVARLRSLQAASAARTIARHCDAHDIDLVCAFFPDATLLLTVALWRSRRPLVLNHRDIGVGAARSALELRLLRAANVRAAGHVANASAVVPYAIEVEGADASRIRVIPNAVDIERFRPCSPETKRARRETLGLPTEPALVGCVSNLRAVKGVEDLVRGFAAGKDRFPDAALVLIGDGELRQPLTALAQTLGIDDRVHFLGRRQDIETIVPCFDLAVLPSHAEGSSNALLEFLACGVPAIATDVGGNAEALQEGDLGLLIPAKRPDAIAEALSELLASAPRRHALATRARAALEATLAPREIGERWVAYFREVVKNAASGR